MQPLKYGLRCLAAKDNSTTHIAAAPRNLDAATTMQSADRVAKHNRNCSSKTHFVQDLPEKVKVEDVKTKLSRETSLKIWKWKMWKWSVRARLAWKSESGRCENEAFARDIPQNLKVEDVKMKRSCETSLKIWKWKMWKRSFRARHPSKKWKWKMWKRSFRARHPSNFLKGQVVKMKPELASSTAGPIREWSRFKRTCSEAVRRTSFPIHLPRHIFVLQNTAFGASTISQKRISCENSLKKWKWKMWWRSFRARHPSIKSESGRCENKLSCKTYFKKVKVEDVKTKLSCENSFKKWKWKMSKRSFRARHPLIKSESGRCENKLSRTTSFEKWKWKMWKRSFRARIPSKS